MKEDIINVIEKQYIIRHLKERYRKSKKIGKGLLLTELYNHLKVTRKHAMRLLSPLSSGRPRKVAKRGSPGKYQDPEF